MNNGLKDYADQNEQKINAILAKRPELTGFYVFMSNKSDTTVVNYMRHVHNFLTQVNKTPKELDLDDFTRYMFSLKKTHTGELATPQYAVNGYHALKKYGNYLVAKEILDKNPMNYIDRPASTETQKTIKKREGAYLDENEIKTLLKTIEDNANGYEYYRDMAIVLLFLNTGIRCSAMYKLDIDSIDLDTGVLIVTDKESKVNVHKLSDNVLSFIGEYLIYRESQIDNDSNALFISKKRNRMSQRAIDSMIRKYTNIAFDGKKTFSPHKLRATYGTQLYNKTGDVYFVQTCMGHSSPTTTERYIRGKSNRSEEAANIMGSLISL